LVRQRTFAFRKTAAAAQNRHAADEQRAARAPPRGWRMPDCKYDRRREGQRKTYPPPL
jgi:hypothetical protein